MIPSWHTSHFAPGSDASGETEAVPDRVGRGRDCDRDRTEFHRQQLLNAVLAAVKRCQVRFGGRKSELATEEGEAAVGDLCRAIEKLFQHGVKTGGVTDLLPRLSGSSRSESSSFWPFIKRHLSKSDLDRFLLLQHVNTDVGRCRAWLRAALNEHTLERQAHVVLSDAEGIAKFYETWAFVADGERSSMLPSMSAGIASIHFALKVDDGRLNAYPSAEPDEPDTAIIAKEAPVIETAASREEDATSTRSTKKKRKVPGSQLVSFDGDEITTQPINSTSARSSRVRGLERQLLLSQTTQKTKAKPTATKQPQKKADVGQRGDSSNRVPTPTRLSFDRVDLEESPSRSRAGSTADGEEGVGRVEEDESDDEIDIYSKSPSGSRKSVQSGGGGGVGGGDSGSVGSGAGVIAPGSLTRLTPMKNSGVGELIPLFSSNSVTDEQSSTNHQQDLNSEDSMSVRSLGDLDPGVADYASFVGDAAQNVDAVFSRQSSVSGSKKESAAGSSSISREEMKQALLSVMARKEELQSQLAQMKKLLEKESRSAASLREVLSETKRKSKETSDRMESRVGTLNRENELLKHQLKKYVGAVQRLRDGPQAYETLAQMDEERKEHQEKNRYVDYHYEASEYEKKLIQVAEMHGELIEFNEHLQRASQMKDVAIARMRRELVELRGPLPEDEEGVATASASLDDEAADSVSLASSSAIALPSSTRALLHIWIPSVFLSGSGTKTHHVYQVYLRIRDEEWNIYRRYSDFYALHSDLKKREPVVDGFFFPPKKSLGNKTEKVVEERRKRLQDYLRQIVNLLVQTNPALAARPNKENVLSLMPFFAENNGLTTQRSRDSAPPVSEARTRSQSQSRSIFSRRRQSSSATQHQTPQLAL